MAGQNVEFASNGGVTQGYLAVPEAGSGPGVIVIQEWWGLNDNIRSIADRFASEGFVALAPDFYHGQVTAEPDEAGKLMMALNVEQAAKDLRGAASYLMDHEAVTSRGVGAVGFCMGGQLALYAATVSPDQVSAVVDFYGIHPAVEPDWSRMRAPVLGLFAERDGFVNAEAVAGLERQLKAAGVKYEFDTYSNADHAYMNDTNPDAYDREAAEDSWRRMLAFFRANVQ